MKNLRLFAALACLLLVCVSTLPAHANLKDEWIQVRSKNFFLIGNASEKDIRKTATKLEQFRETFRLIFKGLRFDASIPTNVVVFKSDSAYKPFKPHRADGKADNWIAGYFQPGEDVNYITLSTEGDDADMLGTIFHEYVHFLLNTNYGKSEVPSWFNEGLAEYYQTFSIQEDQKVNLGYPQTEHLLLLQQTKLMPLGTLFAVSPRQLGGGHSRSIFYAQSWALMHYLIQGGKSEHLGKFLAALQKDVSAETAFKDAFQMDYAQMEKELRKYVAQGSFKYSTVTLKNKLTFDAEMQVSPLSEAQGSAFLGDLLYHTHRYDDAEPYLRTSLRLDPDGTLANTTLGMVKFRQRKYDEAKSLLEKAVARDQKNHYALYSYAYLLSRDGSDEFGYVKAFKPENISKMRDLLKKAIAANPSFAPSYDLLAFVILVSGEGYDEAIDLLKTASKYQPGNERYALRMAEIYGRQQKFADARALVEKIARTTDDNEVRGRAENLLEQIRANESSFSQYEEARKQFEKAGPKGPPVLLTRGSREPTPAELEKLSEEHLLRSINGSLYKPRQGEKQLLGNIEKIDCVDGQVLYSISTTGEKLSLTSKDFQQLALNAYVTDASTEVSCGAKLSRIKAVLTYKPAGTSALKGELVAIDFVPSNFRFVDPDSPIVLQSTGTSGGSDGSVNVSTGEDEDFDKIRRNAMMQSIKDALRKPVDGEKQGFGFIEKSECSAKGMFFTIKSGPQLLRLSMPQNPLFRAFTPDAEGIQLGCGMKPVDVPVVFVYKPSADAKSKTAGEVVSIEFVPKSFTME